MEKKQIRSLLITGIQTDDMENVEFVTYISKKMMGYLQFELAAIAKSGIEKQRYIEIVREEIFRLCDKSCHEYQISRNRLRRRHITVKGVLMFVVSRIIRRCQNEADRRQN